MRPVLADQPCSMVDCDARSLGFGELAAWVRPHHQMVERLGDARGDRAAQPLNSLLGLAARQAGERPGEQERLAPQRLIGARVSAGCVRNGELQAGRAQALHQPAIRRKLRPAAYAGGDPRAHSGQRGDLLLVGVQHDIHRAQPLGDRGGGLLPHEAYAQPKEDTRERLRLALRDAPGQVGGAFLLKAVQREDALQGEVVQIGEVVDQPGVEEALHQRLAQTANVHRVALDEMLDPLDLLRRAIGVDAVGDGFAGAAHGRLLAHRARRGKFPDALAAVAQVGEGLDHLGDHVAPPLDDDGIADAQIAGGDVVLVEERRVGDGDAADAHWLESRVGSQRARAADADPDVEQLGGALDRLELVRDGPAWVARDRPELLLLPAGVDLDHRAVDVEGDLEALARQLVAKRLGLLKRLDTAREWTEREAPRAQPADQLPLALWLAHAADGADAPDQKRERAHGRDAWVFLAERA